MVVSEEAATSSDRSFFSNGLLSSSFRTSATSFEDSRTLCRSNAHATIEYFHYHLLANVDKPCDTELSMSPNLKGNLLCHSRYIRDTLAPEVVREGGKLNEQQATALKTIFASISAIKMTVELLQYSRIEKALNLIVVEGSAWPVEATLLSEALLSAWEESLGSLKNIRADLWGPGGRLEGIKKLKSSSEDAASGERRGSAWSVEAVENPSKAYKHGDLGFKVGDWWIKPAAAFRDGIIDETHNGITADEKAAYAIRMDHDQEDKGFYRNKEMEGVEDTTTKYLPPEDEPTAGIYRLMEAVRSAKPVRLLRSWRLKSPLAPKAGLRYDGLYRVMGHGVKLTTDSSGQDHWKYTFHLSRLTQQAGIDKALAYPLSDQMDDWKDYQRYKAENKAGGIMNMLRAQQQQGNMLSVPRDSGYFSPNPSGEASGAE